MKKTTIATLALTAVLGFGTMVVAKRESLAKSGSPQSVLNEQAVLRDPGAPELGNPKGDVTIVEFFDYQCPYCRKVHPDLMRLLADDGKVRLVLKDWPILTDMSKVAARVALGAKYQGKHAAAHAALMEIPGRLDQEKIRAAALKAGLDLDKLNADLAAHASEIDALLERNNAQAEALNLAGTPAFLVGPYLVSAALSYDEFKKVVAQARTRSRDSRK